MNTFPRDCELITSNMRLGYSHVERAHEAAILEEDYRNGRVTEKEFKVRTRQIQLKRYSS